MIVRGLETNNSDFYAFGRGKTEQAQHHIKMPLELLPQTLRRPIRFVVPDNSRSLQISGSQIRYLKNDARLIMRRRTRKVRSVGALKNSDAQNDQRKYSDF